MGGYGTAAFIASYCLSSEFGVSFGFEHFDENLTVAWLTRRRRDDRPFFALVHYFDPHAPYQPSPPYDAMFDPGYRGAVTGSMADIEMGRRAGCG